MHEGKKADAVTVDLYIAASIEGFIADKNGGTDWVADEVIFEQTSRKYGCICMGHTTYREYGGPAFDGVQHIVLSRKPQKKNSHESVHFVTSPQEAIAKAAELGFKKMLVIGGAQVNHAFMQAGVVRRVFVDIHPIILGEGLQMFGDYKAHFDFTMIKNTWNDDGFMHAEYTIGEIQGRSAVVIIREEQTGLYFAYRHGDKSLYAGFWGLGAGGTVGDDEDTETAAHRELKQKTGLRTPVAFRFTMNYSDGIATRAIYVYETTLSKPKRLKHPHEWDQVEWLSAMQLNELIADGTMCPETKALYQQYRATLND